MLDVVTLIVNVTLLGGLLLSTNVAVHVPDSSEVTVNVCGSLSVDPSAGEIDATAPPSTVPPEPHVVDVSFSVPVYIFSLSCVVLDVPSDEKFKTLGLSVSGPTGLGVGLGVIVPVAVAVAVPVGVGLGDGVAVAMEVDVEVGVGEGVGVTGVCVGDEPDELEPP
jgi:hypothetical protein